MMGLRVTTKRVTAGLLWVLATACGGQGNVTPGMTVSSDVTRGAETWADVHFDGPAPVDGRSDRVDVTTTELTGDASDVVGDLQTLGCPEMPPVFLTGVCNRFCQQLETFELNDLFAPPDECNALCLDVLDEHPDWLPNFLCVTAMEQHYFFGNCWWPKPLPAIDGCAGWCDALMDCGLESALHLPSDDCLCRAACDGLFAMTGEAATPLLECSTQTLAKTCDLGAMGDCYQMPLNCQQVCDGLALECGEGEDLKALFADDEDCIALCQTLSQEQLFGLQVCIGVAGCPAAQACADWPEDPLAGCQDYCEAYNALCPDATIPPDYCPWACTGAALAVPGADAVGATSCINEFLQCPMDEGQSFVGCLAGQCTLMCYTIPGGCDADSAYFQHYPTGESCEAVCGGYTAFQADVAATCHLVAGCDHPELCDHPSPVPVAGCDTYCQGLLGICPEIAWFASVSCPAFCTGLSMVLTQGDPGTSTGCFEAFDSCPEKVEDVVFPCFNGQCGGMCNHFAQCDSDSVYSLVFESPSACHEVCSTMDWETAMAVQWCLSWGACDNAASCVNVPDEAPAGCDTYCQTVATLCPDTTFLGSGGCDAACTGLSQAFDAAQPWDADECFDEYATCPADPAEVVYGCIIDSDSDCVDACAGLHACQLSVDWVCEIFCTELEVDNVSFQQWFTNCVSDSDSCDEMMACVGG